MHWKKYDKCLSVLYHQFKANCENQSTLVACKEALISCSWRTEKAEDQAQLVHSPFPVSFPSKRDQLESWKSWSQTEQIYFMKLRDLRAARCEL